MRPWSPAELELLNSQPELDAGGWQIHRAFRQLSTTRSLGWAPGPIPWDRAVAWCRLEGMSKRATRHLVNVVLAADAIYLSKVAEPEA